MDTVLDVYLSFPMPLEQEEDFGELYKACGSIEHIEEAFDIDFSCGDNKYLSDIEDYDKELAKYDGKVCTDSVPRDRNDGREFKPNKDYRFRIKYSERDEEFVFFLNNKETFRKPSY